MKICLAGDIFINRPLPADGYEGFSSLRSFIQSHDVCLGNLETVIRCDEGYPSLFPGGGYATAKPSSLKDVKRFGFNILNGCNNHSADYGQLGVLATLLNCAEKEIPIAGIGEDLHEASRPVYLETSCGRVALLSVTSSFHDSDKAAFPALGSKGRPGVSSLRHKALYTVNESDFETLQRIAEETGINEYHALSKKRGYLTSDQEFRFGSLSFRGGEKNDVETTPNKQDLERTLSYVREARKSADCVILSIHSHQFKKEEAMPPDFVRLFAKACIDEGVNIVFGHGVHLLRGVEVYKGCPIFYSLGNFCFQNETVSELPADFIERYGISYTVQGKISTAMSIRSADGTRGFCVEGDVWQGGIVSIDFDEHRKVIKSAQLVPIDLHMEKPQWGRGWPTLKNPSEVVVDAFAERSKRFGATVKIIEGQAQIQL